MTAAALFRRGAPVRRHTLGPGWERVDRAPGKIGARFVHRDGWCVEHCGHPTALWPWALYGPDGYMVLAPNGRAWRTLADVAAYVARQVGGL